MMGEGLEITGYAAVFGVPDLTGDIIRPGAFAAATKLIPEGQNHVMMLYQHTAEEPIGSWCDLREDDHGLWIKGTISTRTRRGAEASALVESGILSGLSIGFKAKRSRRRPDGSRDLLAIDLWEVSIVTFPMAPGARIHAARPALGRAPRNLLTS